MKRILSLILCFSLLSGCKPNNEPITQKEFCLDTIVSITIYVRNMSYFSLQQTQTVNFIKLIIIRIKPNIKLFLTNSPLSLNRDFIIVSYQKVLLILRLVL